MSHREWCIVMTVRITRASMLYEVSGALPAWEVFGTKTEQRGVNKSAKRRNAHD